MYNEQLEHSTEPLMLYDPTHTFIRRKVENYRVEALLQPIFKGGQLVYKLPTVQEIAQYHKQQLDLFWPETLRKLNPEKFPVVLSDHLWNVRKALISQHNS
jgi:nicotinate phosphoribosyltransferase